jgi:hypothetical protein
MSETDDAPDPQLGAVARHSLREENMSDAVHLAVLIGGVTLIAISIITGAVLLYQWIRQRPFVERGAAKPEPTTRAGMSSCVGSGMSIVGNVECNGPAQVFGRIEGELRASDLVIGNSAQVEGNLIAQDVTVCGRVRGTIHVVRVKLKDGGGAVDGDIFHSRYRSTRTPCLKDCHGELRTQRSCRRASTPKPRRKKTCRARLRKTHIRTY